MKNILVLLLLALVSSENVSAQDKVAFDYYNKRNKKTQRAMHITLGSWALANFGSSFALMNNPDAPYNKYFYHMNIYWNTVNAAIAGVALAHVYKKDFDNHDSLVQAKEQRRIERLMLMNVCLDVFYIGSGVLLDAYSDRLKKNPELLEGYGKSMIFQGAFLLLFDSTFYTLYRSNGKRFSKMNYSMSATPSGLGFRMMF